MTDGYLKKTYSKSNGENVRDHYDAWAASYDAEITENGYATPGRCAAALATFAGDKSAPVLDFGCGTGLSGLALRLAGFEVIDGLDLSPDMLERAKATSAYRNLDVIAAGADLPTPSGTYTNIAAIGVIGAGAAPISVFHLLMKALPPDGKLVFSFNDHALADWEYEAAVAQWTDCGAARILFKEYGDHLPEIDLKSNVYVIEKS
jgi:predicted TPR repeat methyltransferase